MRLKTYALALNFIAGAFTGTASAQVSINSTNAAPHASAMLDVTSTNKGMLIPRMSKAQKNSIASPATALLIFQDAPDSTGFYFYNGSGWTWLANATNNTPWFINGNAGTDSATHFIGTTDNKPIMLRQNNQWLGQLNSKTHNYYIGALAGKNNGDGIYNTALGDSALSLAGAVDNSTAIGGNALMRKAVGFSSTAVGAFALQFEEGGNSNTGLGVSALRFNVDASENVAVGFLAGRNYSGAPADGFNVFVGSRSGTGVLGVTTGNSNVGVGYRSLTAITTGFGNVATGALAMQGLQAGSYNTAAGWGALSANVSGSNNTVMGSEALGLAADVADCSAFGYRALMNFTGAGATGNNAFGAQAAENLQSGINNVVIGNLALRQRVVASQNVAVGNNALETGSGDNNTAIGSGSLTNITGNDNIGIGRNAGDGIITGSSNVIIGTDADASSTISNATAVGYRAFAGQSNSLVLGGINGINGAVSNTNVGIGTTTPNAPLQFSNGAANRKIVLLETANNDQQFYGLGTAAGILRYQVGATAGSHVFYAAANGVTSNELVRITGTGKLGIGTAAPDSTFSVANKFSIGSNGTLQYDNTVGNMMNMFKTGTANTDRMVIAHSTAIPNTGLQYQDLTDYFNFLSSGNKVMTVELTGSRRVGVNVGTFFSATSGGVLQVQQVDQLDDLLGFIQQTTNNRWTYWIQNSGVSDLTLYYNGIARGTWSSVNGVYTNLSDRRLKKDIQPMGSVLASIKQIQPYLFRYHSNSANDPLTVGFMAQDLQPLFPEAVKEIVNKDGSTNLGIQYQHMSVYAIKAIQEQQQLIEAQDKKIELLEKRLALLEGK